MEQFQALIEGPQLDSYVSKLKESREKLERIDKTVERINLRIETVSSIRRFWYFPFPRLSFSHNSSLSLFLLSKIRTLVRKRGNSRLKSTPSHSSLSAPAPPPPTTTATTAAPPPSSSSSQLSPIPLSASIVSSNTATNDDEADDDESSAIMISESTD